MLLYEPNAVLGIRSQSHFFYQCMGADYSFYMKFIATWAPTFFAHIISVLASVNHTVSISENLAKFSKTVWMEPKYVYKLLQNPKLIHCSSNWYTYYVLSHCPTKNQGQNNDRSATLHYILLASYYTYSFYYIYCSDFLRYFSIKCTIPS